MKKTALIAGAVVVALIAVVGGWLIAKKSGWIGGYSGPIRGELKVLSRSPEGAEIPISTDGLTVMFNKAVVPLTTLDKGRDKSIPLKITPSVDGKFFWLGTHGFIFRPAEPLVPATAYKVEMPAGVVSVDGYKLDKPVTWEFSTVSPDVLTWEPSENQMLLPGNASLFFRFNLAMNTSDVEKKLAVTDEATGQMLLTKRDYVWGDDGHTLRVQFKDELPWESKIKVTLPAGVLAKKGAIGLTEAVSVTYATPPKKMEVTKVGSYQFTSGDEVVYKPNEETLIEQGSGVCYEFSQTIDKKSFEKAFTVDPKKVPYFYFSGQEIYTSVEPDGKLKDVEGYKNGCVAFLDDYDKVYKFSIDPGKIVSLSGAKLTNGNDKYVAKTRDAGPELRSLLTKNILSAAGPQGSLAIPYRAVNVKSVTVRLYPWNKQDYEESIHSESLWDANADSEGKSAPGAMGSLGSGGHVKVPLDASNMTIDQTRLPAAQTMDVPVTAVANTSTRFMIDLATLPQKAGPGVYILEAIANPTPGTSAKPSQGSRTAYSMIQITPVGVAIKRESDHILVWTTDIEKGSPLTAMPVRVTLQKWNSTLGANEVVGESNVITNEQGVGVLNLPSTDDVHACAEVTQPGSESYTCESEHRIGGYRNLLNPAPHYFTYVYTDRPIYKPGQTVYFSSFIRQVREGRYFMAASDTTAEVTLTDSSGQKVLSTPAAALRSGGVVSGQYEIPADDDTPRGDYNLSIKVGKQSFTRTFVVSSYRKPSFKVDLKTEKSEVISGDEIAVQVEGAYFFGAPLRKSKTTWSIMTNTYVFSPDGYGEYNFIDYDLFRRKPSDDGEYDYSSEYDYDIIAYSGEWTPSYGEDSSQYDDPRGSGSERGGGSFFKGDDGKGVSQRPEALDDKGQLTIRYKPDLKKYPTSQKFSVEANVQDPSHQEVSGAEDVIVHKADFYLGVKPEKWVYGAKDAGKVRLVSLDTTGKPTGKKSYSVDVVRREYKYIEKRGSGGYWTLISEPQDTVLKTLSGKTDDKGLGEESFTFEKGGTYRFVAKGKDSKGNEIQSAVELYAWGEGYVPWKLDKPETVELVPDKDSYKVGETAKVLVKSLVPVTKALLTLERGRVLEYKVIDLGSASGGNAGHIEIPITEGMIPNLYLDVVAHVGRSTDAASAHPPLLYFGETELHVEPESKRLSVAITTDKVGEDDTLPIYRPGDKVTVKVKTTDPTGKPRKANVIVSVADESVLRLLDYQLPDLVKKFYYRRPNGVVSASSLLSLKAGDSGQGGSKKRRIFKDTAHFDGHLQTNDQGEASFTFELPDDLTTWVIEALAATDSKAASAFEAERTQVMPLRPAGQTAMGSDLVLTDDTFVGGNRGKFMTTLPLLLRSALPRFAVWGDEVKGQIIANNRNPQEIEGVIKVGVTGDAALRGGKASEDIKFSIPANSEKAFPVELSVVSAATGELKFSAEAKDDKGTALDGLEISLPVKDRYAPEVVASSGMLQDLEEKEQIEIPDDIPSEKGGLDVTFKASIGLAAAPSLRNLIYYPYGCSEQKSATLLALLMARDLSQRFGESYFDALAPFKKEVIEKTKGLDAKIKLIDDQIAKISEELVKKFQDGTGGIRYWPDSEKPNYLSSVQTLVGLTIAGAQNFEVDEQARQNIKNWIRTEIGGNTLLSPDAHAFGLWGLTLDHSGEFNLTEDLIKNQKSLSATGLSHLLMAMKNQDWKENYADIAGPLLSMAKQEPRHTSWPESSFFSSSADKNTSLAALALLTAMSDTEVHPMIPRALAFLLNQKKAVGEEVSTQNGLYLSWLISDFTKRAQEDKTDFKATLTAEANSLFEKSFNKETLLTVHSTNIPVKDLAKRKQPVDLSFKKQGEGTLYYDMVLKYYRSPANTPTREEGLIVSREYYAMDDVKEEKPLTEFKAGETYKGHIALVVPQDLNYILVQDLLPSGFEPVDMTLATTSRAAMVQAEGGGSDQEGGGYDSYDDGRYEYDDVITVEDYGTDYGFAHQEIRDDAIIWSDEYVPAGVYHIRYPVRATTAGMYLMPGATAFEFYEPEIFGRSRTRAIEITESKGTKE